MKLTLASLLFVFSLFLPVASHALIWTTEDGPVKQIVVATGITTNTTTTPVQVTAGPKTFYGSMTGTGAVSVVIRWYGDLGNNTTMPVELCRLTLSGTAPFAGNCPPTLVDYPWVHISTEVISGTGATVEAHITKK